MQTHLFATLEKFLFLSEPDAPNPPWGTLACRFYILEKAREMRAQSGDKLGKNRRNRKKHRSNRKGHL